jgi:pyridinium-3,5-biscarboxylic acid mononucleotide synthase
MNPPLEVDLGFAKADLQRAQRCGIPEVIYAAGKTPDQVRDLFRALHHDDTPVLATRADADHAQAVQSSFPDAVYNETARMILLPDLPVADTGHGHIAVVCAGTSDLPVAEEAALTARFLGGHVTRITDVGVAGLHRLINRLPDIRAARVVIAIAGMEGALPSVLGGLIDRPIIAVPTSVGYGLHLQGLTPLLAMLNSCAPGITVVNVDNGFGAAVAATLINRLE